MARWNVAALVRKELTESFGYTRYKKSDLEHFIRVVDAQHAVVLQGDYSAGRVHMTIGFARRDINELCQQLDPQTDFGYGPWKPLVFSQGALWSRPIAGEPARVDGRITSSWLAHDDSPEEVTEWLHRYVPGFHVGARLDVIEHELEDENPDGPAVFMGRTLPTRRESNKLPLMANQMLWGWRGQVDVDDYLTSYVESEAQTMNKLAGDDLSEREREQWEYQLGRMRRIINGVQTWVAEHPNGIERELAGPKPKRWS